MLEDRRLMGDHEQSGARALEPDFALGGGNLSVGLVWGGWEQ